MQYGWHLRSPPTFHLENFREFPRFFDIIRDFLKMSENYPVMILDILRFFKITGVLSRFSENWNPRKYLFSQTFIIIRDYLRLSVIWRDFRHIFWYFLRFFEIFWDYLRIPEMYGDIDYLGESWKISGCHFIGDLTHEIMETIAN